MIFPVGIDSLSKNSQGDRSVFKVVYVVLESQYQSSLTAACKRINAGQPDVAVEVGAIPVTARIVVSAQKSPNLRTEQRI